MKKFLLMISFLLLFCFNSNVYAATVPEMSKNLAQNILDYYSNENNLVTYIGTNPRKDDVINILKNTDAERFAGYFNTNFINIINNNSIASEWNLTFNNITLYGIINGDSLRIVFYISNNASPNGNNLTFQKIEKLSQGQFPYQISPYNDSGYTGAFYLDVNSNNNFNITEFYINSTPQFVPISTFNAELDVKFDTDYSIVYFPFQYALSSTQEVYYSNFSPSKFFLIGNYYKGTNSDGEDTGGDIEGDTSGDSGGNVDLGGIQTGIDNINNNLNNIENKIPTSGDIVNSTQTGIVNGNTEFWGSSGDLSGDEQEELISGKIDELTNTLSGDLVENEIFGILQTYEDKLFGGFTGEEDFIISWNDVNYNGQKLIPSGEVNFSKICRENEALGNVKSTINIILTFIIMMNIVIYMYNLLLATLGIDNPYLYEKPVGSVTTSEYTDESGRTYVTRTQHDGRGNSISKRYNHTLESKRRQIGFRKW